MAASGLVWAGLAAGERKKVLIVGARAAGSRVVANCLEAVVWAGG